jgi:hypothetical protein
MTLVSLTYLRDDTDIAIASDILELSDKLSIIDRMNTTGLSNSLKNFITAEGTLGMDIDRTEKQLEHIETLNMMSNFSISHFTLNKFEGMDGAMSWLAVIVVVLIVALPILFC